MSADAEELRSAFAARLVQVVKDAGPGGVLLSALPTMVMVAGNRGFNNSECKQLGYGSIKKFIDMQPSLRREFTSGVMRCVHNTYCAPQQQQLGVPETSLAAGPYALQRTVPDIHSAAHPAPQRPSNALVLHHIPAAMEHVTLEAAAAAPGSGNGGGGDGGNSASSPLVQALTMPRHGADAHMRSAAHAPLFTRRQAGSGQVQQWGLLGTLRGGGTAADAFHTPLYLNTQEQLRLVVLGARGSGKSHTLAAMAEACALQCEGVSQLRGGLPMPTATLLLHRGPAVAAAPLSAFAGLGAPGERVAPLTGGLACERVAVLLSPGNFLERSRAYEVGCQGVRAFPLLLDWQQLTAAQLGILLHCSGSDGGGCGGTGGAAAAAVVVRDLLCMYQRSALKPDTLEDFKVACVSAAGAAALSGAELAGLHAKLALLDAVVLQSERSRRLVESYCSLETLVIQDKALVIADLTDPLLSKTEVRSLFAILLQQFRALRTTSKLLIIDDAHHLLTPAASASPGGSPVRSRSCCGTTAEEPQALEAELLTLMDTGVGVRVALAAPSLCALPRTVAEAASVVVAHATRERNAQQALVNACGLPGSAASQLAALPQGHALVLGHGADIAPEEGGGGPWYSVHIRDRITADAAACVPHESSALGQHGREELVPSW